MQLSLNATSHGFLAATSKNHCLFVRESGRKGKVFPSRLTSRGRTDTKRAREPTVSRRDSAGRKKELETETDLLC